MTTPLASYTIPAIAFDCDCGGYLYDPQTGTNSITSELAKRNNNRLPCDTCGKVFRLPAVKNWQ